ncbi:MAG TPA: hypothetical protein VFE52_02800 [Devosia sp.]|jgi:Na+/phosphate symporter|nr:hypothetical protein [Devosia sp.]
MSGPGSLTPPVILRRVRLVWYLPALLAIGVLGYLGFTTEWWLLGLLALFFAIMWLFSLAFALWRLAAPPPEPRQ